MCDLKRRIAEKAAHTNTNAVTHENNTEIKQNKTKRKKKEKRDRNE